MVENIWLAQFSHCEMYDIVLIFKPAVPHVKVLTESPL